MKQCQLETRPVKIAASQRSQRRSIDSPIDRISRLGARALTDAELLSLLFSNGDGVAVAEKLLTGAGCLKSLLMDDTLALSAPGMTPRRAAKLLAAAELSRRIQHSDERRPRLRTPAEIYRHLAPTLQGLRREEFHVLCFNSRNILLRGLRVAEGTMNACPVDPREVFAAAIAARATAIVFAHSVARHRMPTTIQAAIQSHPPMMLR